MNKQFSLFSGSMGRDSSPVNLFSTADMVLNKLLTQLKISHRHTAMPIGMSALESPNHPCFYAPPHFQIIPIHLP